MAQRVQILLEDDIDGSEASQTIAFALDGTSYEIDLNDKHATALRKAMSAYVDHARKAANGHGTARKRRSTSIAGHTPREIRDWARTNNIEVPERGRIPGDVKEQFLAAQQ